MGNKQFLTDHLKNQSTEAFENYETETEQNFIGYHLISYLTFECEINTWTYTFYEMIHNKIEIW